VHDLLEIFQMDKIVHDGQKLPDPRWAEIKGRASGTARVHFVVGGPEDRCGGGLLRVDGDMKLLKMDVYGERYDEGDLDFGLVWDDRKAGANGMKLDVRSAIVRKGDGAMTAMIRHGGVLRAQAIASGVPIGSLDILGEWGKKFDGSIHAIARIGGRLDAMNGLIDVEVSRVRVGPATLAPSRLTVEIVPKTSAKAAPAGPAASAPSTPGDDVELRRAIERGCNNPAGAPYEYGTFLQDASQGDFVVNGTMFGDQIALHDVRISQQRRKEVRGSATAKDLDLGTLANLIKGVAFSAEPPEGKLSASLEIKRVLLQDLPRSEASLTVSKLELSRGGQKTRLLGQNGAITIANNTLTVPGLRIEGRSRSRRSI
jgi:translocation and assembly module TamB